jgi:hypothetical protein
MDTMDTIDTMDDSIQDTHIDISITDGLLISDSSKKIIWNHRILLFLLVLLLFLLFGLIIFVLLKRS